MVELVAIAILAGLLPVSVALALRYAGPALLQRNVAWLRAIAVTLAVVLSIGGGVAAIVVASRVLGWPGYATAVAVLAVVVACAYATPTLILRLSQREAAKILVAIAFAAAVVAGLGLLLSPLAVRCYKMPTNGMGPTLRGEHFVGKCLVCGGETIASVEERGGPNFDERVPSEHSICSKCWRAAPPEQTDEIRGGERIMVRRWATPARWDVVVFPFPKDPRQIYSKRLVGLPGETIQIIDGSIWINGERLVPPKELEHARWALPADQPLGPLETFALTHPYTLGDNECFVLGDNTFASYDSRFWGPVPWDDLRGVVCMIYFPPQAWRTIEKH